MDDLNNIFNNKLATQNTSFYSSSPLNKQTKPEAIGTQFEAIFYRTIFKQMEESQLDEGLFSSSQMQQLSGMRYDEMAGILAQKGHLGIKQLITNELLKNQEKDLTPEQASIRSQS